MSSSDEVDRLRNEVARLERENAILKQRLAGRDASVLVEINDRLMQQIANLEEQLHKVEEENRDFASLYVQVQEQNEAITNLYVASHRLHATIDPGEVMKIVFEILVELVGAEEFGVFLLEKEKVLRLVAGEGVQNRFPSDSLPVGEGVIGEVAVSGKAFYFEPKSENVLEARLPLAAVPLEMNGAPVGVIVVYKLLNHKRGLSSVDHQLLQLLAVHAATALESARLHKIKDRKLRTMEGFVQLLKSQ